MYFGIRRKLMLGFGLMMLLLAAVAYMGKQANDVLQNQFQGLADDNLGASVQLTSAERALWELRFGIANFMMGDAAARAKILADQEKWYAQIDQNMKDYKAGNRTPEEQVLINQWDESYPKYVEARPRWFELYGAGQVAEAAQWRAENTNKHATVAVATLAKLIQTQQQLSSSRKDQVLDMSRLAMIVNLGLLAFSLVVGVATAIYFGRTVSTPVVHAAAVAKRLAAGDLTAYDLKAGSKDEVGDMSRAMNQMLHNFRDLIRQVRDLSDQVAGAAGGVDEATSSVARTAQSVGQAVGQVAQGASSQVRSVQEATAQVDELKTAIRQIADGAEAQARDATGSTAIIGQMVHSAGTMADSAVRVRDSARTSGQSARTGQQVVEETAVRMAGIRETVLESARRIQELGRLSTQVGEITQLITGIADQTNLLALNAAIEAARVGEQGRGFAVVADEVRKLAERASKSASEIAALTQAIQRETEASVQAMGRGSSEVEEGARLARQAGTALQGILAGVTQTENDLVTLETAARQIADFSREVLRSAEGVAATSEENTALTAEMTGQSAQVGAGIQSIAAVSEENAAAAEEVAASAESMSELMGQAAGSARELRRIAAELKSRMDRFQLPDA